MISFLKGKIEEIGESYAVINVHDVGYKVYTSDDLTGYKSRESVKLHTHHHIRENVMDLFGFFDKEDLIMFEILLTVSGIGPKSALSILGKAGRENIIKAVSSRNPDILASAGIGKKTAEKLVAELKDKLSGADCAVKYFGADFSEAADGLVGLGYSKNEAAEALKNLPPDIRNTSDRIKWALKNL
ncbi:Holliday junction DNA helicase RuvA [Candidatus Falkowbacteria bacterium RBG_13_39_14]|uniref:Holliday junction branch migration complex subunit RuvA n=1 Tax=Candidatus Falkowbacteria bacterium RBG_13_39_14 TaxID=1797985 RepID=A0A1F5S562_9BACT|nr:MAG: Holliday junction DNA helicase RuvA [Candidatus Falkowbacteria bacterium RBG_13_39_14]